VRQKSAELLEELLKRLGSQGQTQLPQQQPKRRQTLRAGGASCAGDGWKGAPFPRVRSTAV